MHRLDFYLRHMKMRNTNEKIEVDKDELVALLIEILEDNKYGVDVDTWVRARQMWFKYFGEIK